jgi:hypothetical protein
MVVVNTAADSRFSDWLSDLERRHMAELEFAEVRRGIQALSSAYVRRRDRHGVARRGVAFDGRGKRAAFALFYAPLHFVTVARVVDAMGMAADPPSRIVDLGCGSGVCSAAWSLSVDSNRPRLAGVDASGWAVEETRWNWRRLDLSGSVRRGDLLRTRLGGRGECIVAGWVVNELERSVRDRLLDALLAAGRRGARVLVLEPVAKRIAPWWASWDEAFTRAGGREHTWRFACELPEPLRRLDEAAGLDHRELTARSLSLGAPPAAQRSSPST